MSDPHPTRAESTASAAPTEAVDAAALRDPRRRRLLGLAAMSAALAAACGGGGGGGAPSPAPPPPPPPAPPPPVVPVDGPPWLGFARNAQHSALSGIASLPLTRLIWSTAVDLAPPYNNGALFAHYGSPVITRYNTVVVPVKISGGTAAAFRVEARIGANGQMVWSLDSDYRLPPHNWVPSFNLAQVPDGPLCIPDSGGRLLLREDPDNASGVQRHAVFYGAAAYDAAPASFDATVFINTPPTTDSQGNIFFGFVVTGPNPVAGLTGGGIARIGADGSTTWITAATAAAEAAMTKTQTNAAPALSADERTLYVVVNNVPAPGARAQGRLLALDADTLAAQTRRVLLDPLTGAPAWVNDNATSSPLVGPDGDIYIGVLESNPPTHGFRGWLLHFDRTLTLLRTPGSFGWDNTPSIVPRAMVPQYVGPSDYLLCAKYNSYGGIGPAGDGRHRVAILDPNQTQVDAPFSGATVMREVISILGVTPDTYPGGVKEWCINTAAVDPFTSSVLMNSEDGILYRWHLPTNAFTESLPLNNGYAQSYTPTAIGPDGRVYTVNNARLFSVGV